jgi:hypothetical protein
MLLFFELLAMVIIRNYVDAAVLAAKMVPGLSLFNGLKALPKRVKRQASV